MRDVSTHPGLLFHPVSFTEFSTHDLHAYATATQFVDYTAVVTAVPFSLYTFASDPAI